MSITRRNLRELTMQAVYQYDFYPNPELENQTSLFLEQEDALEEDDRKEVAARVADLIPHIREIDEALEGASEGWKVSRMNKVDLAILRVAVYEMRFDPEVPTGVAINEAVELAKKFDGDNSYQFVNGVLSKLAKDTDEQQ